MTANTHHTKLKGDIAVAAVIYEDYLDFKEEIQPKPCKIDKPPRGHWSKNPTMLYPTEL